MKHERNVSKFSIMLVALIWIVISIYDFSSRLNVILKTKTYDALTEISQQNKDLFVNKINQQIQILNAAGRSIMSMEGLTEGEMGRVLREVGHTNGFDDIYLSKENEKLKKAMEEGSVVLVPADEEGNLDNVIVIGVPLYKGENFYRVLCGVYSLSKADKVLMESSYYGEGYGFIVTSGGYLLLGTQNEKRLSSFKNLFNFFEQAEFKNEYGIEKLHQDIAAGNSGTFAISYEGKDRFVSFTPTGINDWYCLTFATNAVLQKEVEAVSAIVWVLAGKIVICFGILLLYIIAIKRKHDRNLRHANAEYQSLLSNVTGGVLRSTVTEKTEDMKILYISDSFTKLTGYTIEDLKEYFNGLAVGIIWEEDVKSVIEDYQKQIARGEIYTLQYRINCKDGTPRWVMDNGRLLDHMGQRINQSIIVDITKMKEQEVALKLSEERFRIATTLSNGSVFEYDFEKNEYTYFENSMQIFGMQNKALSEKAKELLQKKKNQYAMMEYFYHPDDMEDICKERKKLKEEKKIQYEARIRQPEDTYLWCRVFLYPIMNEEGNLIRYVSHIMDIQQEKKQIEDLKEKAQKDLLTGVYNKVSAREVIEVLIEKNTYKRHALMMIDIDDFKAVNDTLGHLCGDEVLIEVGSKLKEIVGKEDLVGRIGGDEFIVFMPNSEDEEIVLSKARKICEMFKKHYVGEGKEYKISSSIGIVFSEGGKPFQELFEMADTALYCAKANGKDRYSIYNDKE